MLNSPAPIRLPKMTMNNIVVCSILEAHKKLSAINDIYIHEILHSSISPLVINYKIFEIEKSAFKMLMFRRKYKIACNMNQ